MRNSTLRWAIALMAFWLVQAVQIQAQSEWETIPDYEGLEVRDGMLVFSSKAVFDQVYQDLEQKVREWNADPTAVSPKATGQEPCPDDNVVLSFFEQQYTFNSIRKTSIQQECEWLNAGGDPLGFEEHFLVDDILATLFNDSYQLQLGTDIYYLPEPGLTYIIANADLETLTALERGGDPYSKPNVTVHGPEENCMADFAISTDYSSNTVEFLFTGQPQIGNVAFFWDFGDGTVSTTQNPVHTYATGGDYQVCLTIESAGHEYCVDRICKTVQVGAGECMPFFIYSEAGQPGVLCFLDNTQTLPNVISWNWNFGDGSEGANTPNPCHKFPCDKTFFVTLTIETNEGCTGFFGFPVVVDSYGCCAGSASKKGHHYYAGDQKRIKYKQRHLQIPLLYYRVIAREKHYRLKSNGKWKKEAANLKIDLQGQVFLPSEVGCKCNSPFNIAQSELAFNKKTLTVTKAVGKSFKAKKDHEWSARYYVNNSLLTQETTPVICD